MVTQHVPKKSAYLPGSLNAVNILGCSLEIMTTNGFHFLKYVLKHGEEDNLLRWTFTRCRCHCVTAFSLYHCQRALPFPSFYFPFLSLPSCSLITACTVFGAGTFFKPHSPSTSLPAHTHHLPFLGLAGFMKMSAFILSIRTNLHQVDAA